MHYQITRNNLYFRLKKLTNIFLYHLRFVWNKSTNLGNSDLRMFKSSDEEEEDLEKEEEEEEYEKIILNIIKSHQNW